MQDFPAAKISYIPTIKRNDSSVKIRVIDIPSYPSKEYTGFVEFDDLIFFCVMFTPLELSKKNIRKLESIMLRVLPLNVNQ